MYKSYSVDTDGKKLDRRQRKSARRATYDFNRSVSKLLREKRKEARLAALNV